MAMIKAPVRFHFIWFVFSYIYSSCGTVALYGPLYIYIFLRILWPAKKKVYIKDHKGLRFRIYIYSCPTRFRYLLKVRVQHRSSKGVGIAPLPKHMRSSLLFSGVRVAQSFVCCVVLWESLFFVLLFNFLWAGYYLSF